MDAATADVINALFEVFGGFLMWLSISVLLKEKQLIGISLGPDIWMTIWSAWNVNYYYSTDSEWSFYASIFVLVVNTCWLYLAFKYYKRIVK